MKKEPVLVSKKNKEIDVTDTRKVLKMLLHKVKKLEDEVDRLSKIVEKEGKSKQL
jgi:CRISPR/Cas system type I-B associated protein Csh2 (Cas7 group RAMP superfamily)